MVRNGFAFTGYTLFHCPSSRVTDVNARPTHTHCHSPRDVLIPTTMVHLFRGGAGRLLWSRDCSKERVESRDDGHDNVSASAPSLTVVVSTVLWRRCDVIARRSVLASSRLQYRSRSVQQSSELL